MKAYLLHFARIHDYKLLFSFNELTFHPALKLLLRKKQKTCNRYANKFCGCQAGSVDQPSL